MTPVAKRTSLLFGVTIGLGAFLLFLVQFVLARLILPWFGGAAAVWTTCMLFFQVALLLGYLYAHLLTRSFSPRWQARVHTGLLVLTCALLLIRSETWPSPITPDGSWKPPGDANPILQILGLLTLSIGPAFVTLSATSPLLQHWFASIHDRSPYRLFALSNAGSLLGMLCYPFVVEPLLPVPLQGCVWSFGFAMYAVLCGECARRAARTSTAPVETKPRTARPRAGVVALWLLLAAEGALMLLAVTNQICHEVAVVPFLWMLPLAIYLISFIVCFERAGTYQRGVWARLLGVSATASAFALMAGPGVPLALQIGIHGLTLTAYCMVCHGELVRLKPAPDQLTPFYLCVAGGGAAGSALAAVVAPVVFPAYWELQLGLIGGAALLVVVIVRDPEPALLDISNGRWVAGLTGTFAVALLGWMLFAPVFGSRGNVLHQSRSFFGTLRATLVNAGLPDEMIRLNNGATVHGTQLTRPGRRRVATAYYTAHSGVGLALNAHPKRPAGLRIGAAGLGVGTIAAWARPGDSLRFYEISPDVIRLSEGPNPLFTFLRDAPCAVTAVPGDARLSLERDSTQQFDLLVLDVFSSDAVPVHLLTREAFVLYLSRLAQPDGMLAVNITNRSLDLLPVLRGVAAELGLTGVVVEHRPNPNETAAFPSKWVLLSRDVHAFDGPAFRSAAALNINDRRVLWTDAWSNLASIIRWSR